MIRLKIYCDPLKRQTTGILLLLLAHTLSFGNLNTITPQYQPFLDTAALVFDRNDDSLRILVKKLEQYNMEESDLLSEAYLYKYKAYLALKDLKFSQSIEYSDLSMERFTSMGEQAELAWLLENKGTSYSNLGEYETAIGYHLEALDIYESMEDSPGIAGTYNSLGRISYEAGNMETTRVYFEAAMELQQELGDEKELYKLYNNNGIILMDNDIDRALEYFENARDGYLQLQDTFRLTAVLGNLAVSYDLLEERDSGLYYAREAFRLAEELNEDVRIIPALINLGYFQRLEGVYDSAYLSLNRALELSQTHGIKYMEGEIYSELASLFEDLEHYKGALDYFSKQDSIQNLIASEQKQASIDRMILAYSQKAKDREMEVLRERRDLQRTINQILGILIGGSSIVILMLFAGTRKINRQRKLLSEQNKMLEQVNKRLTESEKGLKESIQDKNKLFSIVAHDLRNPVAAISGFTDLLDNNFDKLDDSSKRDYIEQIQLGSVKTLTLLNNLLFWARSQMNSMEVERKSTAIFDLVNETIDPLVFTADNKGITILNEVDESLHLNIDREMIKVVIRNLVSNAIKFSEKGAQIAISSFESNQELCLAIKDEGVGIREEVLQTLFREDRILTTQGTDNETGSGLGLLISKDFTERNGGTLKAESTVGKGSTFTICFKKRNL